MNKYKKAFSQNQRTWIPTIDCNEKQCTKYSHWFDYNQSTTTQIPKKTVLKIQYLSGDIQGYDGKESIKIQNNLIPDVVIPIIFSFKVEDFIFTNFDGVFSLPNKVKTQSLIDVLENKKILENPRFALQIARYPTPTSYNMNRLLMQQQNSILIEKENMLNLIQGQNLNEKEQIVKDNKIFDKEDEGYENVQNIYSNDEGDISEDEDQYLQDKYLSDKDSYLYLGQGIPQALLNKSNWIDTTSTTQWRSVLIGLEHKGGDLINKLDIHTYDVYFETGTTYSLFPTQIKQYIEEILKREGCQKQKNQRIIFCDCSKKNYPILKFYLRGVMLVVDDTIYFNRTGSQDKQNTCLFNIMTAPENHEYIVFGNSLIRKYPMTFDKQDQKMGFYNAKQVQNGSKNINSSFTILFLFSLISMCGLLYVFYMTIRQEKAIKLYEEDEQPIFLELDVYSNKSSFNSTHSRMFNPTLLDEQSFNMGVRYCDMIKI